MVIDVSANPDQSPSIGEKFTGHLPIPVPSHLISWFIKNSLFFCQGSVMLIKVTKYTLQLFF